MFCILWFLTLGLFPIMSFHGHQSSLFLGLFFLVLLIHHRPCLYWYVFLAYKKLSYFTWIIDVFLFTLAQSILSADTLVFLKMDLNNLHNLLLALDQHQEIDSIRAHVFPSF